MPPITRSHTARKAAAPYEKRSRNPNHRSPLPAPLPQVLKRTRDDDDDDDDDQGDSLARVTRQKKARSGSKPAATAAQNAPVYKEAPVNEATLQKVAKKVKVSFYF
ncbi:hypothetical protein JCM21900_006783 [Sporobolomyces salmonicolor]